MASETCVQKKMKKHQCWLDVRTHRALRDLCGAVILACWSCESPALWHRLTERNLEKRFGRLRSSFPNSRMSVPDYWRASALAMRKEMKKFEAGLPAQCEVHERLSEAEFQATVQQGFAAALKFSSFCCNKTPKELQSLLAMSSACPTLKAARLNEDAEEGDPSMMPEPPEVGAAEVVEQIRESHTFAQKFSKATDEAPMVKFCQFSIFPIFICILMYFEYF